MTEPLWSDERIRDWVDDHWQGVGSAEALGTEIRDEYEAKIAELKAEKQETVQMIDMDKWRAFGEKLKREKQERLERKRRENG